MSSTTNDRRARLEEMRRAERSRRRRSRIVVVSLSTLAVAGLVGFGAYALSQAPGKPHKNEQATEEPTVAAKAPIAGEKSWDARKLGRNHVTRPVTYPMKPPVGGDHHPAWMNCEGNVYDRAIPEMNAVHSLEHGAVWVTYNDKAPSGDVQKLKAKVGATPYSLMSPVNDQAGAIMLSAWGKQVAVSGADDPRVDQFFTRYVQGPQTPEPGAACTGGLTG